MEATPSLQIFGDAEMQCDVGPVFVGGVFCWSVVVIGLLATRAVCGPNALSWLARNLSRATFGETKLK